MEGCVCLVGAGRRAHVCSRPRSQCPAVDGAPGATVACMWAQGPRPGLPECSRGDRNRVRWVELLALSMCLCVLPAEAGPALIM